MGWFSNRCFTCHDSMPLIIYLFLISFSSLALADYPATPVYAYGTGSPNKDPLIACKSGIDQTDIIYSGYDLPPAVRDFSALPDRCKATYSNGDKINNTPTITYLCGEVSNGFSPICNGIPPPDPDECQAGCNGACGSSVVISGTIPNLLCIDSCNYGWRDAIESADGSLVVYVGSNKGSQCTVSPTPPAPPPLPCPMCDCLRNGQSYGTVNGAVVCVAKGSPGSQPTKTQSEGKTTTTTPAPTLENPNPVPVVSVQPPVIVTTTPPPVGSPAGTPPTVSTSESKADGSTTQTDQDKDSFCEQNPNSAMCKTQTLCKDNPNLLICKQTDIDQLCKEHPERAECMSAEDLLGKPSDLPNEDLQEKEVNIGEDYSFNPVSMPENATCPPPQSISMYGSTMTVSFDWLCQYASTFRLLLKAFATFLAYGIVAAAIRGSF